MKAFVAVALHSQIPAGILISSDNVSYKNVKNLHASLQYLVERTMTRSWELWLDLTHSIALGALTSALM